MSKVTVPALTSFAYGGRVYRRGDLVEMAAVDAAIHASQGHVSLERPASYRTTQLTAEAPAGKRPRGRRKYRRRDLTSEASK